MLDPGTSLFPYESRPPASPLRSLIAHFRGARCSPRSARQMAHTLLNNEREQLSRGYTDVELRYLSSSPLRRVDGRICHYHGSFENDGTVFSHCFDPEREEYFITSSLPKHEDNGQQRRSVAHLTHCRHLAFRKRGGKWNGNPPLKPARLPPAASPYAALVDFCRKQDTPVKLFGIVPFSSSHIIALAPSLLPSLRKMQWHTWRHGSGHPISCGDH